MPYARNPAGLPRVAGRASRSCAQRRPRGCSSTGLLLLRRKSETFPQNMEAHRRPYVEDSSINAPLHFRVNLEEFMNYHDSKCIGNNCLLGSCWRFSSISLQNSARWKSLGKRCILFGLYGTTMGVYKANKVQQPYSYTASESR